VFSKTIYDVLNGYRRQRLCWLLGTIRIRKYDREILSLNSEWKAVLRVIIIMSR